MEEEKTRGRRRFVYGASRTRTGDLLGAIQALSQLSYSPVERSLAPAQAPSDSIGSSMQPPDVPIPEVPSLVEARIVQHPTTGRDCLLARTEEGQRIAFSFELDSDAPGLSIVDPGLWLSADDGPSLEHSSVRFDATEEARADDWLQALVSHPVSAEWLGQIKHAHPDEYHTWFAQDQYDEGGEQGSG